MTDGHSDAASLLDIHIYIYIAKIDRAGLLVHWVGQTVQYAIRCRTSKSSAGDHDITISRYHDITRRNSGSSI